MDMEYPELHKSVGMEKQSFLYLSDFLAETPVIKDILIREKQINMYTCNLIFA